jgi:chromosome segregation ATPase
MGMLFFGGLLLLPLRVGAESVFQWDCDYIRTLNKVPGGKALLEGIDGKVFAKMKDSQNSLENTKGDLDRAVKREAKSRQDVQAKEAEIEARKREIKAGAEREKQRYQSEIQKLFDQANQLNQELASKQSELKTKQQELNDTRNGTVDKDSGGTFINKEERVKTLEAEIAQLQSQTKTIIGSKRDLAGQLGQLQRDMSGVDINTQKEIEADGKIAELKKQRDERSKLNEDDKLTVQSFREKYNTALGDNGKVQAAGLILRDCIAVTLKPLKREASQRGDAGGGDTKGSRDLEGADREGDKFRQGGGTAGPSSGTGLGGGDATGQRTSQDAPAKPAGGSLPSPYGYSPYGYPPAGSQEDSVEVPHDKLPPFTSPGQSDKPAGMSGKPGKKSGCKC